MSTTEEVTPTRSGPATPRAAPSPAPRQRRRPRGLVGTTVLIAGGLLTAFPFIWMIAASVKPRSEAVAVPPSLLPKEVTFEFYRRLFTELSFGRYLVNTIAIVVIGFGGLLLTAMAGYAFAKFTFAGKRPLFFMVLATMMIPVQVTMIPTYLILHAAHLTNTLLGIAMPTLVSAFGIFLFRQFLSTIPDDMLDAARLDGAGEWRIFWQIVMPNAKAILAVQAVLTFITGWNSFLWPLVVASDDKLYTLSVGVALMNQQVATSPSLQMAAATIMVLPVLVVFIIFQRHVIEGFTLSGMK
jgi:multiple sugar transport system permease protein